MQQLWSSKPLLCRELVGRERELQALQEALQLAASGKPQLEWANRSTLTRIQAQAAREEAAALLEQAERVYTDLHVPAGLTAVQALRNQSRLDAQEKRRHTLMERAGWHGLTRREREVLKQMAAGKSNKEIAAALHISTGTVEQHISHIFTRLGCDTRSQAVAIAIERGLINR